MSSTDAWPFVSAEKVDDGYNCSVSRFLNPAEPRTRQLSHARVRGGEKALSSLVVGPSGLAVGWGELEVIAKVAGVVTLSLWLKRLIEQFLGAKVDRSSVAR